MLCSGHEGEGLNVKRGSFEAEGKKHRGGTFCYSWMLCLGLRSFVLYICYLVLRPYCLNSGVRGSTMFFSELEKPEHNGSDFFPAQK